MSALDSLCSRLICNLRITELSINTTIPLERTRPGSRSGSKPASGCDRATAPGPSSGSQSNVFEDGPWCGDDSGREPKQSPIFSDTFEHSLYWEDNRDKDRSQVAYEFGSNVDSSGDTDSGLRAAQPSSSLSFDVERELRKEAMIIKSESSSPSSNHTTYFTDSHSNSDKERRDEEGDDSVTAAAHTASQASPLNGTSNDIALQLATQLYAFQGCTKEQHKEQDHQHQ
jgi:hypothetical protein